MIKTLKLLLFLFSVFSLVAQVTPPPSGGGIGGSISSGQVAVGTAANTIGGFAGFTYDNSTQTVGIGDGTITGAFTLSGLTSGTVTVKVQDAAGTFNFNLPTGAGTSGQPLLSAGGGSSPMTYGSVSGTGSFCLTTSCTMVTPALGTPSALILTNATALPLAATPLTTRGDILVVNSTPALARLAKGTQYQTLQGGASDTLFDAVHLDQATAVSGVLGAANGGTGTSFWSVTNQGTATENLKYQNTTASTGVTSLTFKGGAGSQTQILNLSQNSGQDIFRFDISNNPFVSTSFNTIFNGFSDNYSTLKTIMSAGSGFTLSNDRVLVWSNNANINSGTASAGLSWISAGVLGVGTGAQGSTSGKLQSAGYISKGTTFTGNGGLTESALTGGATFGKFTVGATTGTIIITMGDSATAPNGWFCTANDLTTPADLIHQTATSTTTASLTVVSLLVLNDVVNFACLGY